VQGQVALSSCWLSSSSRHGAARHTALAAGSDEHWTGVGGAGRLHMSPPAARARSPLLALAARVRRTRAHAWDGCAAGRRGAHERKLYVERGCARRDEYTVEELLGGAGGRFTVGSQLCVREDLTLVRFSPAPRAPARAPLPRLGQGRQGRGVPSMHVAPPLQRCAPPRAWQPGSRGPRLAHAAAGHRIYVRADGRTGVQRRGRLVAALYSGCTSKRRPALRARRPMRAACAWSAATSGRSRRRPARRRRWSSTATATAARGAMRRRPCWRCCRTTSACLRSTLRCAAAPRSSRVKPRTCRARAAAAPRQRVGAHLTRLQVTCMEAEAPLVAECVRRLARMHAGSALGAHARQGADECAGLRPCAPFNTAWTARVRADARAQQESVRHCPSKAEMVRINPTV